MPMDRSRYPDDWEAIAFDIKSKAQWRCENCDRPCLKPGESDYDLAERLELEEPVWVSDLWEWRDDELLGPRRILKIGRFILTTAHPNHDPENPNAVLKAWCAPCHCRYDLKAMATKRRLKREHLGQMTLF